jgi:hypothetical protein
MIISLKLGVPSEGPHSSNSCPLASLKIVAFGLIMFLSFVEEKLQYCHFATHGCSRLSVLCIDFVGCYIICKIILVYYATDMPD